MTTPNRTPDPKNPAGAPVDDPLLQFRPQVAPHDRPVVAVRPEPAKPIRAATPAPPRGAPTPAGRIHSAVAAQPAARVGWVLTFIGGAVAGALAMWLFSAPPPSTITPLARDPAPAPIAAPLVTAPVSEVSAPVVAAAPAVANPPVATAVSAAPAGGRTGSAGVVPESAAAASRPEPAPARALTSVMPAPSAAASDVPRLPASNRGVQPRSTPARSAAAPVVVPTALVPERSAPVIDAGRGTAVPIPPVVARPPGYRGSIVVQSAPSGAAVFVNGQPVGSTPVVLKDVPVGSRALRIEAAGYQRWSAAVTVTADQQTTVKATLIRPN